MGVAAILHTGLTVSDLDRSVAFYRDLLGLELIAQWDSRQPYLRAIVAYPDAELRIALPCPRPGTAGRATTSSCWSTGARAGRAATRTPSTPATATWRSW
jgi:catechol 2,3-dioxygenase-like lactoylglutathione lyase family enzyme